MIMDKKRIVCPGLLSDSITLSPATMNDRLILLDIHKILCYMSIVSIEFAFISLGHSDLIMKALYDFTSLFANGHDIVREAYSE
jgi:hypothetical protein